jgi:DNA repair exonuclease SbcCD ATPase subunit
MINLKNVTMKNFLSVGNVSQAVTFTGEELTLVLGENLDLGGNDNRNGTGKSSILNAISYALYGEALVKIKRDNLINKINSKGMIVTIEFEKDGTQYRIERGRKPNLFKFIVNGISHDGETDEAQGDNRLTQVEVENTIGISHDMFKQIIALNTYNEPFLALKANEQRDLIEQLLGITKLSEKAEKLKVQLKEVKDAIKEEEFRIKATAEANKKIEDNIRSIEIKSAAWEKTKTDNITGYSDQIVALEHLDIAAEIESHRINALSAVTYAEYKSLNQEATTFRKEIAMYTKNLATTNAHLTKSNSSICPTCDQEMDKHTHEKVYTDYEIQAADIRNKLVEKETKLAELEKQMAALIVNEDIKTYYKTLEDALDHKSTLLELSNNFEREWNTVNPYKDQVDSLRKGALQKIDYEFINTMSSLRDHQEFLLKLLTNKDSFIRKKIIEQNLTYLNSRLSNYLVTVGLPHEVKFKSDLEVEITQHGRDFDFDNLSRGERTRLILSLSWAFRDVYESLNSRVNLLFIDELLDNGLDTSGVESSLGVLKKMSRDQNRNVFLISHREELNGRVSNILQVVKENGFTTFSTDSK